MICLKTQLYGFRGPLPTPTPNPTGLKTSQQVELWDRPPYLPKEKIMEKIPQKTKFCSLLSLSARFWGKGSWSNYLKDGCSRI